MKIKACRDNEASYNELYFNENLKMWYDARANIFITNETDANCLFSFALQSPFLVALLLAKCLPVAAM